MQKGLTLIELLVTLTVASILLAVAIPSYENIRKAQEIRNNTEIIFGFVDQVMQKAKQSNKKVSFFLSENNGSWCMGASDSSSPSCDCVANISSCKVNNVPAIINDISSSVSFHGLDGSRYFEFFGMRNSMLAGNISVSNDYGVAKLLFSRNGRIRVCSENNIGGYAPC
ncbi:MAG: prepilin-type N-terminal cleavage/methylation domain-containing protein [Plesiomonas sp.]